MKIELVASSSVPRVGGKSPSVAVREVLHAFVMLPRVVGDGKEPALRVSKINEKESRTLEAAIRRSFSAKFLSKNGFKAIVTRRKESDNSWTLYAEKTYEEK